MDTLTPKTFESDYARKKRLRREGEKPEFEFKTTRRVEVRRTPVGRPFVAKRRSPASALDRRTVTGIVEQVAFKSDPCVYVRLDENTTFVVLPEELGRPELHEQLRPGTEVRCEIGRFAGKKKWRAIRIF